MPPAATPRDESMAVRSDSTNGVILEGAWAGAIAWTAYAIWECAFIILLPWLRADPLSYQPLHPLFTVALFVIYATFGAALGVVGALVLGRLRLGRAELSFAVRAASGLGLSAAFCFNLVAADGSVLTAGAVLANTVGLALAVVLPGFAPRLARFPVLYTHPWLQGLLLLATGFAGEVLLEEASAAVRALAVGACPAALLAASLLRGAAAGGVGLRPPARWGRRAVPLVAVTVLVASLLPAQQPFERAIPPGSEPRVSAPNVILITLDAVRADHLSLYGYERETTPRLSEFAAGATVCLHAVAPSDMTLSTHASLFTGLPAIRHGAHYDRSAPDGRPLADRFETLAEVLRDAGYRTAAVVSNHGYLSRTYGLRQGFEYYDERPPVLLLAPAPGFSIRAGVQRVLRPLVPRRAEEMVYRDATEINHAVLEAVDRLAGERPFLLFVNYMDAHEPYLPPEPYDTRYPGKLEGFRTARERELEQAVLKGERPITRAEREHVISQYDGGIAYIDDQLGRLFASLDERGVLDHSLIVITSDHGEAFGERGLFGHGVSVYEDQVSVPLIVRYPWSRAAERLEAPCSLIDVVPTILDVVGLPDAPGLDGRSLRRISDGDEPRTLVSESFPNGYLWGWHRRFRRVERSFLRWPLKLVTSTAGKRELYDLSTDPDESKRLNDAKATARLQEERRAWVANRPSPRAPAHLLDDATRKRLRQLGYEP